MRCTNRTERERSCVEPCPAEPVHTVGGLYRASAGVTANLLQTAWIPHAARVDPFFAVSACHFRACLDECEPLPFSVEFDLELLQAYKVYGPLLMTAYCSTDPQNRWKSFLQRVELTATSNVTASILRSHYLLHFSEEVLLRANPFTNTIVIDPTNFVGGALGEEIYELSSHYRMPIHGKTQAA